MFASWGKSSLAYKTGFLRSIAPSGCTEYCEFITKALAAKQVKVKALFEMGLNFVNGIPDGHLQTLLPATHTKSGEAPTSNGWQKIANERGICYVFAGPSKSMKWIIIIILSSALTFLSFRPC